jgi:hypothetical protein
MSHLPFLCCVVLCVVPLVLFMLDEFLVLFAYVGTLYLM